MYEWDEAKSAATRKDRGFGFEIMEDFLWDYAICVEIQEDMGESREKWIGPIGEKLYVAIIVPRNEAMRIVSLRIADQTDIRVWRKEIG